jgi:hypothetical protein
MINASGNEVVIHVPMEQAVVRIAGADQKVLRPARGFAWVQHSDGAQSPITNPLYDWFINAVYNSGKPDMIVGFVFESGPRADAIDIDTMDLGV